MKSYARVSTPTTKGWLTLNYTVCLKSPSFHTPKATETPKQSQQKKKREDRAGDIAKNEGKSLRVEVLFRFQAFCRLRFAV
jgi:hypothetical protein